MDLNNLISDIRKCQLNCAFRDTNNPPISPISVQMQTKIMFIGENPSWALDQIVPFGMNTISGQALNKYYLEPLGLTRGDVWITNLFKCRYPRVGKNSIYRNKGINSELIQSISELCFNNWLILIAKPVVIATLSNKEVYQRLRKILLLNTPYNFNNAVGKKHRIDVSGHSCLLFPLIHPDISRPLGDGDNRKWKSRSKWSIIHKDQILLLRSILNAKN